LACQRPPETNFWQSPCRRRSLIGGEQKFAARFQVTLLTPQRTSQQGVDYPFDFSPIAELIMSAKCSIKNGLCSTGLSANRAGLPAGP
jgi:hypothetical protein